MCSKIIISSLLSLGVLCIISAFPGAVDGGLTDNLPVVGKDGSKDSGLLGGDGLTGGLLGNDKKKKKTTTTEAPTTTTTPAPADGEEPEVKPKKPKKKVAEQVEEETEVVKKPKKKVVEQVEDDTEVVKKVTKKGKVAKVVDMDVAEAVEGVEEPEVAETITKKVKSKGKVSKVVEEAAEEPEVAETITKKVKSKGKPKPAPVVDEAAEEPAVEKGMKKSNAVVGTVGEEAVPDAPKNASKTEDDVDPFSETGKVVDVSDDEAEASGRKMPKEELAGKLKLKKGNKKGEDLGVSGRKVKGKEADSGEKSEKSPKKKQNGEKVGRKPKKSASDIANERAAAIKDFGAYATDKDSKAALDEIAAAVAANSLQKAKPISPEINGTSFNNASSPGSTIPTGGLASNGTSIPASPRPEVNGTTSTPTAPGVIPESPRPELIGTSIPVPPRPDINGTSVSSPTGANTPPIPSPPNLNQTSST